MGFGMFSVQHSPIAIDFGAAMVKLLQIGAGDRPPLLAAAAIDTPDYVRTEPEAYFAYLDEWLPAAIENGRFKGRRAVIAVPAAQTFIQHMQLTDVEGSNRDDMIKSQLQAQMGCPPHGVVVRPIDVCTVHRNGQTQKEVICFAVARDNVMRYVDLLKKCKLEAVGVHTDTLAMIRAFDHIHRRASDVGITTLYIDLGWGGTRVAITHGKQPVFARHIPIGGKHFDQTIAAFMQVDPMTARSHRLSMRSATLQKVQGGPQHTSAVNGAATPCDMPNHQDGAAPAMVNDERLSATAVAERRVGAAPAELQYAVPENHADASNRDAANVDLSELLDTITDEMSMCLRYHQGLFPQRPINRAIFVGGESRQSWLCQHIVKALRVPAQLGDPVARFDSTHSTLGLGVELTPPQPGWAVACGLCSSPTDM